MLFSGCLVTSIHPLGTDDDIVFDENLIGAWDEGDDGWWIFMKKDYTTYNLNIADGRENGKFSAKLVKLGDKLFLDIYPERLETGNIMEEILLQPTHTFMRYSLVGDELSLGFTDPEWFTKRIDRNEDIGIDYVVTEDDVITLTASTEELQAFYLKHAGDSEFFDLDDDTLHRSENSDEVVFFMEYEKEWSKYVEQLKKVEMKEKAIEKQKERLEALLKVIDTQKTMKQTYEVKRKIAALELQKIDMEQRILTWEQQRNDFEKQAHTMEQELQDFSVPGLPKTPPKPKPLVQPKELPEPEVPKLKAMSVNPGKPIKREFPPEIMEIKENDDSEDNDNE
jgi:hypothetical protein